MNKDKIIIIDFGGQYNQLIARRVRELGRYCEIYPYTITVDKIKNLNPTGIILTGGPNSVYGENAPALDTQIFDSGIPILGICYGAQLLALHFGGKVSKAAIREYGVTEISLNKECVLFENIEEKQKCLMSHTDYISELPDNFKLVGKTKNCPTAAFENIEKRIYGVQFHPEVEHTTFGMKMLENYVLKVCGMEQNWTMSSFIADKVSMIREKVGEKKVLCALSGGVDSAVAAVLVHRAVGDKLTCIFIDHGLLRKGEGDQVEKVFRNEFNINLVRVNAEERFLSKLANVSEPERKRKIIGEEFIRVFEEESKKLGKIDYLVQGTIYPDVVESGTNTSAKIKSHHNVGGLPENIDFEIIEPLRELFKDEVRRVGKELGLPDDVVMRQPFPGPGLAIRVLGEITKEKLAIVREADAIFREEIANAGLDRKIWQYFACLPNIYSVGVMGDERTYCHTIALRAVTSSDGMTSDWAKIPFDVLDKVSKRIVNEVKGANRVVYDITSKPPATIEWE